MIQQLLTGSVPAPPSDRKVFGLAVDGVSRLPQKAVFASFPNSVVRTYDDQSGPGSQWEFVAQNRANDDA